MWTSGGAFTDVEAAAIERGKADKERAIVERRERLGNPRVYLDVSINDGPPGRIEFVLYAHEAPRGAENFRAMCTGEKGGKHTFQGMHFYRILDAFIDQARAHIRKPPSECGGCSPRTRWWTRRGRTASRRSGAGASTTILAASTFTTNVRASCPLQTAAQTQTAATSR
jgi:hypothetical protein